jgi:hypothetical protein
LLPRPCPINVLGYLGAVPKMNNERISWRLKISHLKKKRLDFDDENMLQFKGLVRKSSSTFYLISVIFFFSWFKEGKQLKLHTGCSILILFIYYWFV